MSEQDRLAWESASSWNDLPGVVARYDAGERERAARAIEESRGAKLEGRVGPSSPPPSPGIDPFDLYLFCFGGFDLK